jgi:pimeloyl-ACP methyl ester carboxylesterase
MMKRALSMATIAASVACFAAASEAEAAPLVESSIVIDSVAVRPGVQTDVHLRVFANANKLCKSSRNAIFAIPGLMHTAATFRPLAQALFDDDLPGQPVCRIVAIDLPGHGESPAPRGALFGDLTADDYLAVILGSARRLRDDNHLRPRTLMGHGQGGMLVQMAQQALLEEGTSLRPTRGRRWTRASSRPASGRTSISS